MHPVMGSYMGLELLDQTKEDDLTEHARSLLNGDPAGWEWRPAGMWVNLTPVGARTPLQGWKLHIAATNDCAKDVLSAVMPILLRERVQFKFAANRGCLTWLNEPNAPRPSAGKFMTVYPADDTQAVGLASLCDRATERFTGPVILSDRPLRPGSLVHYRYGGFVGSAIYNNDGELIHVIYDPDGNPVPDERRAYFTPPAWVADPFNSPPPATDADRPRPRRSPGGPVLLNGRYVVRQALKHANKGGVYLAEDREGGGTVVIKEARPHVEAHSRTGDIVGFLQQEARLLRVLNPLGRTPKLLEVFEQQGHVFLVLEHFLGQMLREVVAQRVEDTGRGLGAGELEEVIRQLAEMMQAFHDAGVLARDFTPNNLMVLPGGELRLVDLELGHLLSDGPLPSWGVGTPGFCSPEQMEGRPTGRPDDYYSLGAVIGYIATGQGPNFPPDLPTDGDRVRPLSDRLESWIVGAEHDGLVASRVCDLVLGCMADDPSARWSPRQVLDAIDDPRRPLCAHEPAPMCIEKLESAVHDIGRWLARHITPNGQQLWPTTCTGMTTDPCNVQSGASGVGLFLCRALQEGGDPALGGLVRTAAKWVADRIEAEPQRPPGLYFGLSGEAWFLAEAAACLEDPDLAERARTIALGIPATFFNPDITHGTAGIALGQLHQWARSGDARFLERAEEAAKAVTAAARPGPHGIAWPVPKDVASAFAGLSSYGFAHGIAGIAYFLLCAAAVLGETRYRDLALEGLETLMQVARVEGETATWEAGETRTFAWVHWCNGSSGVGTALVRAYSATGDERYLRMAELAAGAVVEAKWRSSLVQCHGLAGNAEFLLDLHTVTGEERFRDTALELARVIYARRVYHDGLVAFPDESEQVVTASFNTGIAGIGSFLLRLLHGGPRPLMVDELLVGARR